MGLTKAPHFGFPEFQLCPSPGLDGFHLVIVFFASGLQTVPCIRISTTTSPLHGKLHPYRGQNG